MIFFNIPFINHILFFHYLDIFHIIKAMKEEFNIEPSEETLLHFILPFINTYSAPDIMKTLIEDYNLSAENVLNSLLQHYLSKRQFASLEKCRKSFIFKTFIFLFFWAVE